MGYLLLVLFIAALGFVAYFWSRKSYPQHTWIAEAGTAVLLIAVSIWSMFHQVPAGHVGLVYTFGAITGQRGEGLQWVAPWQDVANASIRVQSFKFERLDSFSSETQDVFVAATINVQVSPEHIQQLYREVGPNWFNVLVWPRVNQAFKDETVKYVSTDIAPKRQMIRRAVSSQITKELERYAITVTDLLIDNISFSQQFQAAIEEKQANTQYALAEKEKVQASKAIADQKIEDARGQGQSILDVAMKQAEANRALSESITPEYIKYIFASKLAPNVNVMMVPSGQEFILGPDAFKQTTTAAAQ